MTLTWGLLGPGKLASERRTRTLGLAASVRLFNDLAVPGVGGVWFGKQLFLATLGVRVAQHARERRRDATNIETANAIEALACKLTFDGNKWARDPRMRGREKLQGRRDLAFKTMRQRGFYVTQPMRMATVQGLPALGLAEADSVRFNAFACTQAGQDFLDAACADFAPYNHGVIDHLVQWACGTEHRVESETLRAALSPLTPLPMRARALLMERLIQGGASEPAQDKQRRRDALAWVESLRTAHNPSPSWTLRPPQIGDDRHWEDLKAGALFLSARDAAIEVLDALEAHIGNQAEGKRFSLQASIPDTVTLRLAALKHAADAFLSVRHADKDANVFCGECSSVDRISVLKKLVARDDRVLRLRAQEIVPGPAAFRGAQQQTQEPDEDADVGEGLPVAAGGVSWPAGISFRVRNLFLLNADLRGELDSWLDNTSTAQDSQ